MLLVLHVMWERLRDWNYSHVHDLSSSDDSCWLVVWRVKTILALTVHHYILWIWVVTFACCLLETSISGAVVLLVNLFLKARIHPGFPAVTMTLPLTWKVNFRTLWAQPWRAPLLRFCSVIYLPITRSQQWRNVFFFVLSVQELWVFVIFQSVQPQWQLLLTLPNFSLLLMATNIPWGGRIFTEEMLCYGCAARLRNCFSFS